MDAFEAQADFTATRCHQLVEGIMASMQNGLSKDGEELKMIPSYVSHLDSGHGTFYALDLGGTNFRVLRVQLNEHEDDSIQIMNFVIDPQHMLGSGSDLFDFLASCIHKSMIKFGDEIASLQEPVRLGFTFSFPCQQTSINEATLIRWTKGFTATDVEGRDVVALLHSSLKKLDVHVHVDAVVNDTVGTLMAKRRSDSCTVVGIILGTGTNGCYIESIDRIKKWHGGPTATGKMCVNMEWGNFGHHPASRALLSLTEADIALDEASLNPGEQIFEKLFGGMYLGDIARRLFNLAADKGDALKGSQARIAELSTQLMGEIERLGPGEESLAILRTQLGVPDAAPGDAAVLVRACRLASTRAARISACAVAAVVRHMLPILPAPAAGNAGGAGDIAVAVDGSVYKLYPGFKERMAAALKVVPVPPQQPQPQPQPPPHAYPLSRRHVT